MATIESHRLLSPSDGRSPPRCLQGHRLRRIQSGELPAMGFGGNAGSTRLRVPEQALERWVASDPPDEAA